MIKVWIKEAEAAEDAAATAAAADGDAEMDDGDEGAAVPAVVRASSLGHTPVAGGGGSAMVYDVTTPFAKKKKAHHKQHVFGLRLPAAQRRRPAPAQHSNVCQAGGCRVLGGARAVATSGAKPGPGKEKISVERQRVSLDTTQPCKNVWAAGEQLSRSPSCH